MQRSWPKIVHSCCIYEQNRHSYFLNGNSIDAKDVLHIIESIPEQSPNQIHLILENNNIRAEGALYLSLFQWKLLYRLCLNSNNLGPKGCKYLSYSNWNSLHCISLSNRYLYEDDNNVGLEGCKYLSKSKWKNIQTVMIKNNKICSAGLDLLIKADWKRLRVLFLDKNNLNYKGCCKLTRFNESKMRLLSVRECGIEIVDSTPIRGFPWEIVPVKLRVRQQRNIMVESSA